MRSYASIILLLIAVLMTATRVYSAPDSPSAHVNDVIAQGIILRANKALSPYLVEGAYRVSATVETNPAKLKPTSLYSTRFASPESVAAMSIQVLRDAVTSYSITIFLGSQYQKQDQADIAGILKDILLIDTKRGDKITFQKMLLRKTTEDAQSVRELAKAQSEMSTIKLSSEQIRLNAEQIRKERDDIKTQLSLAKNELDRIARESNENKIRLEQQSQNVPMSAQMKRNAVPALTAILVFIGLAVLGAAFFSIARRLDKGMVALAGAMRESGGNDQQPTPPNPITLDSGPEEGSLPPEPTRQITSVGQNLDVVYSRLNDLRTELNEMLTHGSAQTALFGHLNTLLATPQGAVGASLILELIGRENANKFYKLLSADSKEELMRCLRNPNYEKSKAESMLDAGEELKTRMVVEGLERSGTDGSNAILDGLARLSPSQLVDLTMKVNIRLVPRFFSYLSSTKMAEVMNAVNAEDPNRLELLLPKLLLIPKYQTSTEFDAELEEEIAKCLADQSGNEYKPLLKRYVELIENSADEIAESIYETLATEPVVAKFLRTNVVLFTTLFKLKSEIQSEVINTLSVKETATLLHHLAEPEKNLILATIYGRNLELIQEELTLQEGQGKSSKTERLFKDVKIKIVKTLRAYKTAGNLEFSDGKDQQGSGSVQKTMDSVA